MELSNNQLQGKAIGQAGLSPTPVEPIEQRMQSVIADLSELDDPTERLSFLIDLGKGLKPMSDSLKSDLTLIKGCQSRLWLHGEFKNGRMSFSADSDAAIVKGIAALLLFVYDQATPKEILEDGPEFLAKTGISSHLSMNRRNGLANLSREIQVYAARFMGA